MVKLAERSAAYIWNPNGDIDFINPSAIMADISAGDLKNAETGVAGKFHPPPPLGSMRGGGGGGGGTNPPIPVDVKYIRSYEIRQIIYESEEGFIFTKKKTTKEAYIDISTNNNVMYPITKVFAVPNTFSIFQYTMNQEYAELYQRSYQSFQTLIANIAGISNFILVIMKIITSLLIDKYMYYHLADDLIPRESSSVLNTKSNLLQSSSLKIPKESMISKISKDNSNININSNIKENKDIIQYKMTNVADQYKKEIPIQHLRMYFCETVFYRLAQRGNIYGSVRI